MKKQLMSIMAIGIVAIFLSAGTFAYFSDTETITGNTFTAGILDMEMCSGSFTFDKLKPGDTWSIEVILRNIGDFDIKYLFMRDENYVELPAAGVDIGDVIDVASFVEYEYDSDGTTILHGPETCDGSTYESWLDPDDCYGGVHDGYLSLNEFFMGFPAGTPGGNDYWDLVTLSDNWGDGPLEVGHYYKMVINLEFRETNLPQDDYQGASCSFDLVWMGTHADKTEIDGYVSP